MSRGQALTEALLTLPLILGGLSLTLTAGTAVVRTAMQWEAAEEQRLCRLARTGPCPTTALPADSGPGTAAESPL